MKIIVCIKQVPESPQQNENGGKTVERTQGNLMINELDRYALEAALRIKEKCDAEITALSMGNEKAEAILRDAIAMGVDRTVLLTDSRFAGSDTQSTSYILSQAIRSMGKYDLILCGRQSSDGDTAQVGPQLSEKLNAALMADVTQIMVEDGNIYCERWMDEIYLKTKVCFPSVITVNRAVGEPRVPTVRNIIKSRQAVIEQWSAKDFDVEKCRCGLQGSPTKVEKIYRSEINEKNPVEIMGNPEQQAEQILRIIEDVRIKRSYMKPRENTENYIGNIMHIPISSCQIPNGGVWIFGEQREGQIIDAVWEIASKCNEIYGEYQECSLILFNEPSVNDISRIFEYGLRKIYVFHAGITKDYDILAQGEILAEVLMQAKPDVFLLGATSRGRSLGPWLASRLRTGITADCIDLRICEENVDELIQIRPSFSGNLIAEIRCPTARPQMATIRPGIWKKKQYVISDGQVRIMHIHTFERHPTVCGDSVVGKEEDNNISEADLIIEGGRGILDTGGFTQIRYIVKALNGCIGATRAAVDAHAADYRYQIGQTGKVVRPQICIAVGISGALEHMVGIRDAGVLIAINSDENAPIFNYADYKVVTHAEAVLQKMWDKLRKMEDK